MSLINNKAYKLTNKKYNYNFNYYIGDAFKLDLYEQWKIEYVDGVFVNPPFHDETKKGTTQHKLWIDLTNKSFDTWLNEKGLLYQMISREKIYFTK